ncbi:MAG: hypothetical protein ACE14S_12120 [Candidatus Bathyarchaeia archaeon]
MAIPATFLILFVSTLGLISVTYYFAVEKVNTRSQTLKITEAKQDFVSLDEAIISVISRPGSAAKFELSDSGGQLEVEPLANNLTINVADVQDLNETVFSGAVGQIAYELPYAESPETGLFLNGNSRTIVNQSGSVMSQLFIRSGDEHPEIVLRYRPNVSCTTAGVEDGKPVNVLRVYVVNLNASEEIALYGRVPVKIACESTSLRTETYSLSYDPETVVVTSTLDGTVGQAVVPISGSGFGAVVNVEVVECNIKVERCLR